MTLKTFIIWLKGRPVWATEMPLAWANLALVVGVGLVVAYPGQSDLRLRIWGTALQLMGVATVWHDLTKTARSFGKTGFMEPTWSWLRRFFPHDGFAVASFACSTADATASGRATVRKSCPPDAPIEMRLAALEANVKLIDESLNEAFRELDTASRELEEKIKKEVTDREEASRVMTDKLSDAVAGNYSVLAFGAWWLAVGVVLSTLAPEIAKRAF